MKPRKMCCLARTEPPPSFCNRHVTTFRSQSQVRTSVRTIAWSTSRASLARLADRLARRPLPVVVAFVLVAAAALAITLQHLRIDTSTTEMISPDVSFRRNLTAFQQAFPEFGDTVVAVIEGDTPERVDQAASALADRLRASDHFTAVELSARRALLCAKRPVVSAPRRAPGADRPPGGGAAAAGRAGRGSEPARARRLPRPGARASGGKARPHRELDRMLGAMARGGRGAAGRADPPSCPGAGL